MKPGKMLLVKKAAPVIFVAFMHTLYAQHIEVSHADIVKYRIREVSEFEGTNAHACAIYTYNEQGQLLVEKSFVGTEPNYQDNYTYKNGKLWKVESHFFQDGIMEWDGTLFYPWINENEKWEICTYDRHVETYIEKHGFKISDTTLFNTKYHFYNTSLSYYVVMKYKDGKEVEEFEIDGPGRILNIRKYRYKGDLLTEVEDDGSPYLLNEYDSEGHKIKSISQRDTTFYTYDNNGLLVEESQLVPGTSAKHVMAIYKYKDGLLQSIDYPNNTSKSLKFTYKFWEK